MFVSGYSSEVMRWIDWDDEITAVVLQRSRKFFLTAMKSLTGTVWCLRQFHRCCRTHPKRPHHCCHIPNKVENINHLPDIPYSLQWARHISPKLLLPRWMWAPPNTLFLAVSRVRTPNDTSIGSAVSVVLMTVVTNRHTDAHTLHSCLA